jgi:hypothetical protein
MIECTEFIGNLITNKKNTSDKKFEHLLQSDEILDQHIRLDKNKFLNKKRRTINLNLNINEELEEGGVDEIFQFDWRKQN